MLGIQLIPMRRGSPTSAAIRADQGQRGRGHRGKFDQKFGDYLLMYAALAEPRRALAIGRELRDSWIDDGNSRAYMLAWLLTARAGELRPLP